MNIMMFIFELPNPTRNMLRYWLFALLIALLFTSNQVASEVPTNDEVKAYDDKKNESELFHLILEKKFGKALERLKQVPSESRTMIEILGGKKKQEVVLTGLPLHFAFSIDLPNHLPTCSRQEGMGKEQLDLIAALLKENPLAAAQKDNLGRVPLQLALTSPNPTSMDVILDLISKYPKGAQMRGEDGQTPLHLAVSYPMTTFENFYAILQAYPEAVEAQDEFDALPLHAACWGGDLPDAQKIIEFLAMQNPKHLGLTDDDGETPLMLMAKYGRTSEDALRFMLEQDPKAVYKYIDEQGGNSPLHHAVASSMEQHTAIYKPFVEIHPDLLQKINRVGQLPLHLALQRCCADPKMLLDLIKGFPQAAASRDGQGYLPIHHATNAGVSDVAIVEALLEASPESAKEETVEMRKRGPLPLHFALAHGEREGEAYETATAVVEVLLDKYPEAAKIKDPDTGTLPLHQAFISKRSPKVLKTLMMLTPEEIKTEIYVSEGGDKKATTILHLFAAQAHSYMESKDIKDIIQLFVDRAPEMFKQKDADGRLPLHMVWMQTETQEESRRALVDALLTENSDAAHQVDNDNSSVLSYIAKAKDLYSFEKAFAMNPFAAAIKSSNGVYPLHQLCKEGTKGNLSENVDRMMTSLLAQHPAAAAEPNEDGNLPLHSLCESAGASRVETHTIQKLINAYPDALNTTDRYGQTPLHIVGNTATDSEEEDEHEYWTAFVHLLVDVNPESVRATSAKGKPILASVLDKMETLSTHRRRENDHVLNIAKHLYKVYPEAVLQRTTKKRTGLHTLLALLGDMGGMTPTGWSDFTLQVIGDFPELAQMKDVHDRNPLHIFTLYLGDTSVESREKQEYNTRLLTDAIEKVYVALIETYPDALNEKEEYENTPVDLASSQRLRYAKGGRRFYNADIINMMKRYLRRGSDYWKMKRTIGKAGTCSELQVAIHTVQGEVGDLLEDLDIKTATGQAFTCDVSVTKLCQACPSEQEMLGVVAGNLDLYAARMEADGRDENEVSGDYYVDAKGEYVNEE